MCHSMALNKSIPLSSEIKRKEYEHELHVNVLLLLFCSDNVSILRA